MLRQSLIEYGWCMMCKDAESTELVRLLSKDSTQTAIKPLQDSSPNTGPCFTCSVEDEHHFLFDCPAYCHIRDQHSNLFQHSSPTVASFVATGQPGLLGRYLRKCFSRRHFVLTSLPITLLSCLRTWAQKRRIALIQRDAAC